MPNKPCALSLSKCMTSISLVLLLTACASPPSAPVLARYPEAADLQPCQPLDRPADGSLASVYRAHVSAADKYHACSARHDSLIAWVKRGIEAANAPVR